MVKEKKKILEIETEIIEGVEVKLESDILNFKGQKGENNRKLSNPCLSIAVKDGKIILKLIKKQSKSEVKILKTFVSHIKNLMKGVSEGHTYKLKICSGHFPMNVTTSNNEFVVKNFIGEKIPRTVPITQDVTVKIEGTEVIVEGVDKEKTSQMAARIEEMTKRPGFDTRIFQDGIYIINKDGKEIKHD